MHVQSTSVTTDFDRNGYFLFPDRITVVYHSDYLCCTGCPVLLEFSGIPKHQTFLGYTDLGKIMDSLHC